MFTRKCRLQIQAINGGGGSLFFKSLLNLSTTTQKALTQDAHMVDYLIDKLGFSEDAAIAALNKVPSLRPSQEKADSVVNYLKKFGVSKTHIRILVSASPRLLCCKVGKTLEPKFKFFQELGLSGFVLCKVVLCSRRCDGHGLDPLIKPRFFYLRQLMGTESNLLEVLRIFPQVLSCLNTEIVESNVRLLSNYGITHEFTMKLMVKNPIRFFSIKAGEMEEILNRVENVLGIPRESGMFRYGVEILFKLSMSTVDEKFGVFRSFGWSDSEILGMVRILPLILSMSGPRIREVVDYFMNELGYTPDYLASRPVFLTLSFEKRVKPRYEVLRILNEKKLNKRKAGLFTVLTLPESKFLKYYILPYKDILPDVYNTYLSKAGIPTAEQ
ncbi:OLC1v1005710C2 [Oldenlandia corymbosa var. corymbosa]|uniref:OLC1v1005710C2 n=1 Tax=Oldenlandia corymbosa var. corymbosa TaxID=529605 RepID=A0AAV1DHX2_OLDCO|nr:OLC1v1005710C2 [Oldenlandia corymbosa var. corymbosa]